MYPIHLIPSFIDEPPIIMLENVIIRFRSLDDYWKRGSSPSSFFWNGLQTTETVLGVCFKVILGVNSSRASGEWWKGKGNSRSWRDWMRRSGIGGHLSISSSIRRGMGRSRGRRRGTRLHRGMLKGGRLSLTKLTTSAIRLLSFMNMLG